MRMDGHPWPWVVAMHIVQRQANGGMTMRSNTQLHPHEKNLPFILSPCPIISTKSPPQQVNKETSDLQGPLNVLVLSRQWPRPLKLYLAELLVPTTPIKVHTRCPETALGRSGLLILFLADISHSWTTTLPLFEGFSDITVARASSPLFFTTFSVSSAHSFHSLISRKFPFNFDSTEPRFFDSGPSGRIRTPTPTPSSLAL